MKGITGFGTEWIHTLAGTRWAGKKNPQIQHHIEIMSELCSMLKSK